MKDLLAFVFAAAAMGTSLLADEPSAGVAKPKANVQKSTFLISGLHCPPCTSTVERSLKGVKGVRSAKVDWATKNAMIEFDQALITPQQLANQINATPHMMGGNMRYSGWLALKVPGIDAVGAGDKAKAALSAIKGVSQVAVYPQQSSVGVAFAKDGKVTTEQLIAALKDAGFEATLY